MSKDLTLSFLEGIDRRIIAWILIVVIAFPYLRPLGIPIEINEHSKGFYEKIDSLEPGSPVLIVVSLTPSSAEEVGAGCSAMIRHITHIYPQRNNGEKLKLLILMSGAQGLIVWENFGQEIVESSNYEYGKDWVNLGFIAGGETMIARLAEDIPSLVATDHFGEPIENIAVMEGIDDHTDISLIVPWDASEMAAHVVKHWASRGVQVGAIVVGGMIPTMTTFWKAGDLIGFIGGSRGSGELELLIGRPGPGVATTDTLSMSHAYLILLILIGNIGYVTQKFKREK